MFPELTDEQQIRVRDKIEDFIRQKGKRTKVKGMGQRA
jgi:hypothetical protein